MIAVLEYSFIEAYTALSNHCSRKYHVWKPISNIVCCSPAE